MKTIQSAQLQPEGMGPSRTLKGVCMLEMLKERKAALEAQGKKGFTLMEMLIVIAIIAILIAIAIPLFTSQLNAAKDAQDEANARSIYALVTADEMVNTTGTTTSVGDFSGGSVTVTLKDGTKQTFTFSDRTSDIEYDATNHRVVRTGANGGATLNIPN